MENGRCSRRLLRAYPPSPVSSSRGREGKGGWVGDCPSPIPGPGLDTGTCNPCLVLGTTICQLAPSSQAFLLFRALFRKAGSSKLGTGVGAAGQV